jgi:hypothetical protein
LNRRPNKLLERSEQLWPDRQQWPNLQCVRLSVRAVLGRCVNVLDLELSKRGSRIVFLLGQTCFRSICLTGLLGETEGAAQYDEKRHPERNVDAYSISHSPIAPPVPPTPPVCPSDNSRDIDLWCNVLAALNVRLGVKCDQRHTPADPLFDRAISRAE